MAHLRPELVTEFRTATRHLVRELGLMNKTFSETGLGLTEVHGVVELAAQSGMTAKALGRRLLLEKSTVSRLVRGLIKKGVLMETRSAHDGRAKHLHLTDVGQEALSQITHFAEETIRPALLGLSPMERTRILEAIELYGRTLTKTRTQTEQSRSSFPIQVGYRPGLSGQMAALHGTYYADTFGFTPNFEAMVAREMGDLACRLDHPDSNMWSVWDGEQLLGAVACDGAALAAKKGRRVVQIRCFIVSPDAQGLGLGAALLDAVLADCDGRGVPEIQLFTLRELPAALHLYHKTGFELISEELDEDYGAPVHLQWLRREKPQENRAAG